ncbi:lamin tail domain-containing protein [Candidatus Woesearchaeota archaeon]|nr:lamin tail domain-containing protein [Candidatus Woesearchaeota archaeon]
MRHYVILILFLSTLAIAQPQINEVMYNSYDDQEWVELYNPTNQILNLSNSTFSDSRDIDELICCRAHNQCSFLLSPRGYLLLVDQDSTLFQSLPQNVSFLCVDDNSLGNGLSNTAENLSLTNNNLASHFTYTFSQGANGNNHSLERREDNSWAESITLNGTPGYENSIWFLS